MAFSNLVKEFQCGSFIDVGSRLMMDKAKECSACEGCVYICMDVVVLHCSGKYVPASVRSNPA